ncbi:MAG: PDZ domain-containing protein [Proteobacteria bacterium]|nr:PDZ domain-containing protein [Pseudomonadota bacterium]
METIHRFDISVHHFLIWLLLFSSVDLHASRAIADGSSPTDELDMVWQFAKQRIYPKALEQRFTNQVLNEIKARRAANLNLTLAELLNPFLTSLGVSHTRLYDEHQMGYYLLRSMFTTRNLHRPKVTSIGVQVKPHPQGLLVRSVLEDYPAHRAGINRGDIIIGLNGKTVKQISDFFPFRDKTITLEFQSRGMNKKVKLRPVHESFHYSLFRATRNSVRVIERGDKKIGYIHLLSGTHKKFLRTLRQAVFSKFKKVDGLILDLRDGYGGAWWEYLDPFFENTDSYFVSTTIERDGTTSTMKPYAKKRDKRTYKGPMVVLINQGVRSGKEALAHQFKKTKRARLVGTKTQGASTAGLGGFAKEKYDFLLYLSVCEFRPDGQKVEGIGIEPDIEVKYKRGPNGEDSQMERAIQTLLDSSPL